MWYTRVTWAYKVLHAAVSAGGLCGGGDVPAQCLCLVAWCVPGGWQRALAPHQVALHPSRPSSALNQPLSHRMANHTPL